MYRILFSNHIHHEVNAYDPTHVHLFAATQHNIPLLEVLVVAAQLHDSWVKVPLLTTGALTTKPEHVRY